MYYVENIIHEVYLVDPKNICHLLPADSPSLTRVSILKKVQLISWVLILKIAKKSTEKLVKTTTLLIFRFFMRF